MDISLLEGNFEDRLRKSISFAWRIFMEKVSTGLVPINKEASMQLHYAYILQQVMPLICFTEDETVNIELETGININGKKREIDLVLEGKYIENGQEKLYKIAVEMKCYRTYASTGKKRGATDIFMKDVYKDLQSLEECCLYGEFDRGVALVMNDMERFVNPKTKNSKCWDYDISQNATITIDNDDGINLTTPIGGEQISIYLKKSYNFEWIEKRHPKEKSKIWFLENEGI